MAEVNQVGAASTTDESTFLENPTLGENVNSTPAEGSEQLVERLSDSRDAHAHIQSDAVDIPCTDASMTSTDDKAKSHHVVEIPPVSTLEEKIIRQIEFYFGDRNFPRDKHLQQAVSANANGWVPLTYLLNFNRLKELSTDTLLIYKALNKATAGVIEVKDDDGGYAVRRNPSRLASLLRSKEESHEIKAKTVSVKGFPLEAKFDDVQQFFDKYGKTKLIQMRRTYGPEKAFKGSVFAEFETKADAEKFLSLNSVQYQGQELFRESKEAYFVRQKNKHQSKPETEAEKEQLVAEKSNTNFPPGAILHFKGCGAETCREDIKEAVSEFADVAWIDFSKGCTEGYVRFKENQGALKALQGLNATGGQLNGADCVMRVLEGEEEERYWSEQVGQQSKGGGRGRGRGGRGGKQWRGQKRRQKFEDEGPISKQKKKQNDDMNED